MNAVRLDSLHLLDLQGQPVDLRKLIHDYLLLIFLRHLA
jgi:hypothetical protein